MTDTGCTPRALIAEHEPRLAAVLGKYLRDCGLAVSWMSDPRELLPAMRSEPPELLILDIGLLEREDAALSRELGRLSCRPPCIVTVRDEHVDRLMKLEFAADDVLRKPFERREAVARIRAVLRRPPHLVGGASRISIHQEHSRAALDGNALDLTPVQFRLLRTLASAPGRVFSFPQLHRGLYTDHRVVTRQCIASHVKNLRRKLRQAAATCDLIESVYGVGYRLQR